MPTFEANSYIPHFFTQDELSAFFKECDSYVIRSYQERRHITTLLNRLQFRKIWSKVSNEKAVEYDLRSLYAVSNISKWENHGYKLSGKLLFLSRSMGHRNIQSIFGYFHLTPMLTDKLKCNCAKKFSELLSQKPEYYEENI